MHSRYMRPASPHSLILNLDESALPLQVGNKAQLSRNWNCELGARGYEVR
jgi:hypothetical protein